MRTTLSAVLLVTFILLVHTSYSRAETIKIPLHKISPVGITDLKCDNASLDVKLPIPERWSVRTAVLNFGYVNSSALLAENSRLVVKLNGYPLAQLALSPVAPEGEAKVQLPGDMLEPGYNNLTFSVSQHYTLECENPCAPELWTTLMLDKASLEINYELKPVPMYLSSVSNFLFDPKIFPYAKLNIVSEYKSPESASLASTVASGVALRFDYRTVVFSTSNGIKAGVDNVLIGDKEFIESFLGGESLNISGPYLQILPVPSGKAEALGDGAEFSPGAVSAVDNTRALIVVSGSTPEQIRTAATALAVLSFPFPNADRMEVKNIALPEVRTYTGKSIIRPGSEYSFATLGFPNQVFKGASPQPKDLTFRLPADLLIEPNRYAELSLHLVYGAGMRSDSVLNILLNGEPASAIHLDNPNGAMFSDYKLYIPTYLFTRGENTIRFQPVLTPSVTGQCTMIQTGNLFLSLYSDSMFKFPASSNWVDLPRIELFFQDGFPFTRWPDGRETTLYITTSDNETIGSALNIVGLISQKIGYPLLNLKAGFEKPSDSNEDIIVVGRIETVPDDLKNDSPLKYSTMVSFPYPVLRNLDLNDPASAWEKVKNSIFGRGETRPESLVQTAYSEQTAGLGGNQGVMMEFESPYKPGRSVLMVTAGTDKDLEMLSRAMLESPVQGKSSGSLALVDFTSRDDQVWSLNVGDTYYIGNRAISSRVNSFLNSSKLGFFGLLAASLLILTVCAYYLLKGFRRKRFGN